MRTAQLYDEACRLYGTAGLMSNEVFMQVLVEDLHDLRKQIGRTIPHAELTKKLFALALNLHTTEVIALIPTEFTPAFAGTIEEGRYRDHLLAIIKKLTDPRQTEFLIRQSIMDMFSYFIAQLPPVAFITSLDPPGTLTVPLIDLIDDIPWAVDCFMLPFMDGGAEEGIIELGLFAELRAILDKNYNWASEKYARSKPFKPADYKGDPRDTIDLFLKGTPFPDIFLTPIPFSIGNAIFEHRWVVAPQGAGKTQYLQYEIAQLLEQVQENKASVVVMDSQGDLIKLISGLRVFAEGLRNKICLIEPTPDFPLALNLFDMGKSRLRNYDGRVQETLTNNTLDLLTYVFNSLLGSDMTPKQATLFRNCIRLCRIIPGAHILTFAAILKEPTAEAFKTLLPLLPIGSRAFFENEFSDPKQFAQTKQEVSWRLSLMLENTTFARMFGQPYSKLDLFTELNSSKVILINTDKSLLGDERTELFGRFFIAMLLQASQERATIERENRLPVYVFVDECQDYIANDTKITTILDQARKMNISLTLANQRTSQLSPPVLDALTNVSVKVARAVNDSGAHILARNMGTKPQFIAQQPVGSFAISVRNAPAVSVKVTPFVMEKMPRMTDEQYRQLRQRMCEKYSSPFEEPLVEPLPRRGPKPAEPEPPIVHSDAPATGWGKTK